MQLVARRGIKLSLNDHPGYANTDESILSFADSHAPQALKALGRRCRKPRVVRPRSSRRTGHLPPIRTIAASTSIGSTRKARARVDADPRRTGRGRRRASRGVPRHRLVPRRGETAGASPGRSCICHLGEVAADAIGSSSTASEATHSTIHWPQRLTYTDITPYARSRPDEHHRAARRVGRQGVAA